MTIRRIVPAHIPDPMFEAGEAAISESFAMKYGNGMAARRVYAAMLDASPASGKVSEAEVEKAARAAFNNMPWEALTEPEKQNRIYAIKRALASLELEVE